MADIELVIKILESNYNQIKSTDDFYLSAEERLIKNGTPLPKGHVFEITKDGEVIEKS